VPGVSAQGGGGCRRIVTCSADNHRLDAETMDRFAHNDVEVFARYRTTAAVCPNRILRSSSVRLTGWPKFGLTSFASA
jgi:hypothetical protein